MDNERNEIDRLIDSMIENSDDFVKNLKSFLPNQLADSVDLFQESNAANLRKIQDFLNK